MAAVIDEGALTFDLAIPCEVFGLDRSDIVEPWYSFELVSAGPPRITTQTGFVVEAPASLEALRRADTVVVPGWSDPDVVPGPPLVAALREAHERGARVVGLCTGAFVLAAAGLLDGRRATTHWLYAARLAEAYPQVRLDPKVLYVADDEVMTSAGTAAGIDLCLHVVSLDYGSEVAASVARRLVMPLHREGGQAQYIDQPLVTNGPDAMAELLSLGPREPRSADRRRRPCPTRGREQAHARAEVRRVAGGRGRRSGSARSASASPSGSSRRAPIRSPSSPAAPGTTRPRR